MAQKQNSFRGRAPIFTLALQNAHMQHRFPGFVFKREGQEAVWRGALQPRDTSAEYRVEVRYALYSTPKVKVISPKLASNPPHLYPDNTLCLYWPKEWWWRGDRLIADTILPWSALWLYYYELWLDTGAWLGPSSHNEQPKYKQPTNDN